MHANVKDMYSLVTTPMPAPPNFSTTRYYENGFAEHGWRRTQGAMFGMRRRLVNGDGTAMGDFRLSQPFPTRWPARPSEASYSLAAFRPPVRQVGRWSAEYTF